MVHKLRDDYGENSVNAKLTNEQADHIRRLHRSGVMQNELAEQFKVCKQTICDIVHYKKYKKMKVTNVTIKKANEAFTVMDSFVGKGLVEGGHSALP